MPSVAISAHALVSIVDQVTAPGGDIEGLLFGVVRRARSELQDDPTGGGRSPQSRGDGRDDDGIEIEIQSYIQCGGGVNGAAQQPWTVDELGLPAILDDATVAPSQTLLGWATGRRSVPLRPSIRDSAMVASLAAWRDAQPQDSGVTSAAYTLQDECGVLLGRFGSSVDHGHSPSGAVHSFDSRMYWQPPRSHAGRLRAVELTVRNLGKTNKGEYDELTLSPSFGLVGGQDATAPLWAAITHKREGGSSATVALPIRCGGAVAAPIADVEDMVPQSVAAMEALTTASIAQLEHLANEVVAMEGKADELRRTIGIHRQRRQQQQLQQQQQQQQLQPHAQCLEPRHTRARTISGIQSSSSRW